MQDIISPEQRLTMIRTKRFTYGHRYRTKLGLTDLLIAATLMICGALFFR